MFLKTGEPGIDLGERGVKGLRLPELWPPGDKADEFLSSLDPGLAALRSKLATLGFLVGILDGD